MKILKTSCILATILLLPTWAWAGHCTQNAITPGSRCEGLYPSSNPSYTNIDPMCRSGRYACYWRECYDVCQCESDNSTDCCAVRAEGYNDLTRIRPESGVNGVSVYEYQSNAGQYTCELELIGHKCAGGYFGAPVKPYEIESLWCESCIETLLWDDDPNNDDHPVTSYGPTPENVDAGYWTWDNIETEDEYACYIEAGIDLMDKAGKYEYIDSCYFED